MPTIAKSRARAVPYTAAYSRAPGGGYTAELLEAKSVYTQGPTIEEARTNLLDVIALMLEEAPHQFRRRRQAAPPGALTEAMFVVFAPT